MTLNASGNLGVGDTSPTAKLDVFAGQGTQLRVRGTSSQSSSSVLSGWEDDVNGGRGTWGSNAYTATVYASTLTRYNTTFSGWAISGVTSNSTYTDGNDYLQFLYIDTAGTTSEFARINNLGNIAIGTTPSRWFSNRKALQLGGSVGAISSSNGYEIGLNFFVAESTAADKRVQTGYTNKIYSDGADGDIRFATGGTGAAGSNITWGEKMRLTTDGNLLVGTTSLLSAEKLTVVGTGSKEAAYFKNDGAAYRTATFENTNAAFTDTVLILKATTGSGGSFKHLSCNSNAAEVASIKADGTGYFSGNLLVGTTSQYGSAKLSVSGSVTATSGWTGTNSSAGKLGGIVQSFVCERNGVGTATNVMAFGNGSTAGKGIRMPFAGKLLVATLTGIGITGTVTLDVYQNGTANSSYRLTATATAADIGSTQDFSSSPLSFAAGDTIGWYQTVVPTVASVYNVTFYVIFD